MALEWDMIEMFRKGSYIHIPDILTFHLVYDAKLSLLFKQQTRDVSSLSQNGIFFIIL